MGWGANGPPPALDPDNWRAHSYGTVIHRRWAAYLLARGQDPSPELDAAAEAAEKALALRPAEATLWVNWATVLRNRAEREMAQGRDPDPFLARAEAGLQKAPGQADTWCQLLDAERLKRGGQANAARALAAMALQFNPTLRREAERRKLI